MPSCPQFGLCPFFSCCLSAANPSFCPLLWNLVDKNLQTMFLLCIWLPASSINRGHQKELGHLEEGERTQSSCLLAVPVCWLQQNCSSSCQQHLVLLCHFLMLPESTSLCPLQYTSSRQVVPPLYRLEFQPLKVGSLSNFLGTNNSKLFLLFFQSLSGSSSYHYSFCLNAVSPFCFLILQQLFNQGPKLNSI